MIELLFFICGFALCFTYFVFYKNTKVKITPNKSLSEFENIILSEQKILDQIPDQIII